MNLKSYRDLFIVITLVLTLVAASPVLATVISFQSSSDQFTELWLLGPDRVAGNFPFDVSADEMYTLFVNVVNNMHGTEYYLMQVKFRSIDQLIAENVASSTPSSISPLYEFRFSIADKDVWESTVNFSFNDVSFVEDTATVGNLVVNGITFPIDSSTTWDSEANSFFFQLFFELWRYNVDLNSFEFDNRYVGIWLNMTQSSVD